MKDFLNGYRQHPPFSIQVEPTEGCNLGCSFCGLQGMKKGGKTPWRFMSIETASKIAAEIARAEWKSKIVFALHGEPTLNKNLLEIVKVFRTHLPNAVFHMYTNGCKFNRSEDADAYTRQVFDAGIDNIIVDCYTEDGDWRFTEKLSKEMQERIVVMKKKVPLYTSSRSEKRILLLPPIYEDKENVMTRRLANHSGAAFPLNDSFNNKRCTMPFREMSFRYDGSVAICCDDFRGRYPIANIHDTKIEDIWNHPRFQAARIMLYSYSRDFAPCRGCTNVSVRVGFLPDPSGQDSMPTPDGSVIKYAQAVTKDNEPLSEIVKREWEK